MRGRKKMRGNGKEERGGKRGGCWIEQEKIDEKKPWSIKNG